MADRESNQSNSSSSYTDGSDFTCTKFFGKSVILQTRYNGTGGYDHGNDSCVRNGYMKDRIHGGPCGAQKCIRKSEADECQIDYGK